MSEHSDKWYKTRLQRYFDKYYKPYEDTAQWYVDPAINRWQFDIPQLKLSVTLICDDNGRVTERRIK